MRDKDLRIGLYTESINLNYDMHILFQRIKAAANGLVYLYCSDTEVTFKGCKVMK